MATGMYRRGQDVHIPQCSSLRRILTIDIQFVWRCSTDPNCGVTFHAQNLDLLNIQMMAREVRLLAIRVIYKSQF